MVSGWWLWGGLLARSSLGWAPWLQSLGLPPLAGGVLLQGEELAKILSPPLQPAAGADESLGCSIILGLQASTLPPLPSQPQNFALWLQPAADVFTPKPFLAKGVFVIFLPCGCRGQGYPFLSLVTSLFTQFPHHPCLSGLLGSVYLY